MANEKYYKVGTKIWWSQPEQGKGRIIHTGTISEVLDSSTADRLYLVSTPGPVIRMCSHTRAMTGKAPKTHEGYD